MNTSMSIETLSTLMETQLDIRAEGPFILYVVDNPSSENVAQPPEDVEEFIATDNGGFLRRVKRFSRSLISKKRLRV